MHELFRGRVTITCVATMLCTVPLDAQAARGQSPRAPASSLAGATAADSAQAFYFAYRAAFPRATSLRDLKPWMTRDGYASAISIPKDQQPKVFRTLRVLNSSIKNIQVFDRVSNQDTVVLRLRGVDARDKQPMNAAAVLVREDGRWKLRREEWTSEVPRK